MNIFAIKNGAITELDAIKKGLESRSGEFMNKLHVLQLKIGELNWESNSARTYREKLRTHQNELMQTAQTLEVIVKQTNKVQQDLEYVCFAE